MRLTIITPVLRPEGALKTAYSLHAAASHPWELEHRLCYWSGEPDTQRQRIGTWLTHIIATTAPGWLLFVDDDNRLHPDLPWRLAEIVTAHPHARAVAVDCVYPEMGGVLRANPHAVAPGRIDGGQVALHTDLARHAPWPNSPTGDGEYLQALYRLMPEAWVFVPETLAYHNHQVWGA